MNHPPGEVESSGNWTAGTTYDEWNWDYRHVISCNN